MYKCLGAKVARKMGAPNRDVLSRLSAARKCEPGSLEAFYQMHTTRAKVLLKLKHDLAAAAVAAPEQAARTASGGGESSRGSLLAASSEREEALSLVAAHAFDLDAFQSGGATWDALWQDAAAAVRACSRLCPLYHKVGSRRAPHARAAGGHDSHGSIQCARGCLLSTVIHGSRVLGLRFKVWGLG